MHKIDIIVIDSLGLSMYGAVTSDDDVKRLNAFLNEDIRKDLKCGYVFIHHLRKGGIDGQKKENDLDDSFGSGYIANNAQTVMILSQKPGSPRMHIKMHKTRLTIGEKEFDIERTPDRGFKLVGAISDTTPPIEGEIVTQQTGTVTNLGKLFGL